MHITFVLRVICEPLGGKRGVDFRMGKRMSASGKPPSNMHCLARDYGNVV